MGNKNISKEESKGRFEKTGEKPKGSRNVTQVKQATLSETSDSEHTEKREIEIKAKKEKKKDDSKEHG